MGVQRNERVLFNRHTERDGFLDHSATETNSRERVGEKAVTHTLALVFSSYALNILWYLRHGVPEEDVAWARAEATWYRNKEHPSYNDMLAAMRKKLWVARLSQHPLGRLGRKVIELALPHWKLAG